MCVCVCVCVEVMYLGQCLCARHYAKCFLLYNRPEGRELTHFIGKRISKIQCFPGVRSLVSESWSQDLNPDHVSSHPLFSLTRTDHKEMNLQILA